MPKKLTQEQIQKIEDIFLNVLILKKWLDKNLCLKQLKQFRKY